MASIYLTPYPTKTAAQKAKKSGDTVYKGIGGWRIRPKPKDFRIEQ